MVIVITIRTMTLEKSIRSSFRSGSRRLANSDDGSRRRRSRIAIMVVWIIIRSVPLGESGLSRWGSRLRSRHIDHSRRTARRDSGRSIIIIISVGTMSLHQAHLHRIHLHAESHCLPRLLILEERATACTPNAFEAANLAHHHDINTGDIVVGSKVAKGVARVPGGSGCSPVWAGVLFISIVQCYVWTSQHSYPADILQCCCSIPDMPMLCTPSDQGQNADANTDQEFLGYHKQ
jgi:hypothetical protein